MQQLVLAAQAATHQTFAVLLGLTEHVRRDDDAGDQPERDRGAVSLEQVLWFAAAGISVAVIAAILYQRITDVGNDTDIVTPDPPAGG